MASDWPFLTGGRYSEVVVRAGLTVYIFLVQFRRCRIVDVLGNYTK
jgi:hypothetical protein